MIPNLLLWLDSSPAHYWLAAWATFGCFAALAVAAFVCARERAWWQGSWLISVTMLAVLLAFRWPVLLDNRQSPNADESQFISGAMTLRHDPVYWRSVDGTTRGPLDDWPLTAASFLRGSFDYTTARMVTVLLLCIELICAWLIFRHLFSARLAALLILPLLGAHCFTQAFEFVAYCSEQVPDALVAIGCWLLVTVWHPERNEPDLKRLMAAGVVLGAIPYAKLQAVPIALIAGAAGVASIFTQNVQSWAQRRRALQLFVGGSLLPSLLIVGMVLIGGAWSDFSTCYILENFRYVTGSYFPPDRSFSLIEAPRKLIEIGAQAGNFNPFFFCMVGFGVCGLLLFRWFTPWHRRCACFAGAVLAAAVFAAMVRGRSYVHYLQLLIFPAGLFGGVVVGALSAAVADRGPASSHEAARERGSGTTWGLVNSAVVALFVGCGLVPQTWWRAHEPQPFLGRFTATRGALAHWPVSTEILRYAHAGERLGMWGWMPAFWVETQMIQATRDGETSREIEPHPRRDYYRARYLADLRRSSPPVFVDAVGRWNFVFTDRAACGYETFPELRAYIDENYRFVRELISTRIYVRKDRLDER
jgi:hypothetical protein